MSTKVIVNAQGVRELIKGNPEIEVELAKSAADKVAQAMRKRAVNIDRAVQAAIDAAMQGNGWGATVRPEVRALVERLVKDLVVKAVPANLNELVESAMRKEIRAAEQKVVDRVLAAAQDRIMRNLDDQLDELITKRLGKLSLTVASR